MCLYFDIDDRCPPDFDIEQIRGVSERHLAAVLARLERALAGWHDDAGRQHHVVRLAAMSCDRTASQRQKATGKASAHIYAELSYVFGRVAHIRDFV
eukprot:gene14809-9445_t